MSVFAEGLMRKAKREMKKNFKETGIYETDAQRRKRSCLALSDNDETSAS